jgi:hypothetical protein
VNRRTEQRRAADAKRRKLKPWRKLYHTPAWRIRRAKQLAKTPYCEPCARMGKSTKATTANHKIPHRGDRELFHHGELESACDSCHNQFIQQAELRGFRTSIGEDGWPTDASHPFNKPK